jgi:hypothetical protein
LVQTFSLEPCFQIPSFYVLPLIWETKFNTQQNQWQNYGSYKRRLQNVSYKSQTNVHK